MKANSMIAGSPFALVKPRAGVATQVLIIWQRQSLMAVPACKGHPAGREIDSEMPENHDSLPASMKKPRTCSFMRFLPAESIYVR